MVNFSFCSRPHPATRFAPCISSTCQNKVWSFTYLWVRVPLISCQTKNHPMGGFLFGAPEDEASAKQPCELFCSRESRSKKPSLWATADLPYRLFQKKKCLPMLVNTLLWCARRDKPSATSFLLVSTFVSPTHTRYQTVHRTV